MLNYGERLTKQSFFIPLRGYELRKFWHQKEHYRGCQITSPPVVSGGFVGQVKPREGGSKNCGFALEFNTSAWFQENLLDMLSNRGGGSNLTPTVSDIGVEKYGLMVFQRRVGRIHTIPGHDSIYLYTAIIKLRNP